MRQKRFASTFAAFGSLCLLVMLGSSGAQAQTPSKVPRLEPSACATQALKQTGAQCYAFHGPENWDAPNGHQIELPVGVITPDDATATDETTPVLFFPGGPGHSVLEDGNYLAQLRNCARTSVNER